MTNIDQFNLLAGLIFDQALTSFPKQFYVDKRGIVKLVWEEDIPQPGEYDPITGYQPGLPSKEQTQYLETVSATKTWLIEEGFLRGRSSPEGFDIPMVLTAKGLSLLGRTPSSINEKNFASELREHVKEGAFDAVKQTMAKIIVASTTLYG